jgi:hypothetical protein
MSSEMVDAMYGEMELMAAKIEQSEMALLEARARVVILEDAAASLEEALERIVSWSKAYPIAVFQEPTAADFDRAAVAMKACGLTLDAIAASCMRHVVVGVGRIAVEALENLGHKVLED